jgi:hypothetical protein
VSDQKKARHSKKNQEVEVSLETTEAPWHEEQANTKSATEPEEN